MAAAGTDGSAAMIRDRSLRHGSTRFAASTGIRGARSARRDKASSPVRRLAVGVAAIVSVYAAGAVLYSVVENSFPAHGGLSQVTRRS